MKRIIFPIILSVIIISKSNAQNTSAKIDTSLEIKKTLEFLKAKIEANGDKDPSTTKGNSIEFELLGYSDKADCKSYTGSYRFDFDLTAKTITLKHIYSYECITYKTDTTTHRFQKEETYKIPLKELGKISNALNDITVTTKKTNPAINLYSKKSGGITKNKIYQDQTSSTTNLSKDFKILNISQKDPKTLEDIIKSFQYLFTLIGS